MTRRGERWLEEFFADGLYELEYARYFDVDQDRREADLIAELLALEPDQEVLDLCCGHGRHAVHLAPRVSRLVGLDRTARFVELARAATAELPTCELLLGDARDLELVEEVDGVYCFFTSWGYHTDEENLEVLRRVRRALRPGGRFLLELAARDSAIRALRDHDEGQLLDGTQVVVDNTLDLSTGRVRARRAYQHRDGSRRTVEVAYHLISPDELRRRLLEVGFSEVSLHDGESGRALTLDSARMIALARR